MGWSFRQHLGRLICYCDNDRLAEHAPYYAGVFRHILVVVSTTVCCSFGPRALRPMLEMLSSTFCCELPMSRVRAKRTSGDAVTDTSYLTFLCKLDGRYMLLARRRIRLCLD